MITVDGSYGEGGGQIFRNALAYAAVMQQPVRIINIRAKRRNPGLRPQHLTVLKALAEITDARIEGAKIGSTEVIFVPRTIKAGRYKFDVGTAGSITLILQGILPVLLFASEETWVELRGGTDVPWSPPIDAIRYVLRRGLLEMGAKFDIVLKRRGHYPRGGGIVHLRVEPVEHIKSITLVDRGSIVSIRGISHCVKLPRHVAERQARSARDYLRQQGLVVPVDIDIETYPRERDPHLGPGSGIVLWAETEKTSLLSGDALGAKGKPAEKVGLEAASELYGSLVSGATVDVHHADQLVVFMALADGTSEIVVSEVSSHTNTALYLAREVIGAEYKILEKGSLSIVRVKGVNR